MLMERTPQRMSGTSRRGTTLMEVLVVIVIFLVGILAVVQIFPKGFQILLVNRNNSASNALANAEQERQKANPDQLPTAIGRAVLRAGRWEIDESFDPNRFAVPGNLLLPNGVLRNGGNTLGPWQLNVGANAARMIIGEGRRVPAPRAAGTGPAYYGSLMVLQYGPIDYVASPANISAYGNDLVPVYRAPDANETLSDAQYYVVDSSTNAIGVWLPVGDIGRQYRVTFSAYVNGSANKRSYLDLRVNVPAGTPDAVTGQYAPAFVSLGSLIAPDTLNSVDVNTLAVQRAYEQIAKNALFEPDDPYEFKVLDTNLGILLFNPAGSSTTILKDSGREPLMARVNYQVYDWGILRDEFRLAKTVGAQQVKLSVSNLKVAGQAGIDGRPETNIPILESAPSLAGYSDNSDANESRCNNLVILDMETGGVVMERYPNDPLPPQPSSDPLVTVNKNTGVITFHDSDGNANNGTQGRILLPDGNVLSATLENRALRALYRVRNEFSVQVLKAPSVYTQATTSSMAFNQFYAGGYIADGSVKGRIYFAPSTTGRSVDFGSIKYVARRKVDNAFENREMVGQVCGVHAPRGADLPLPYVNLFDYDDEFVRFGTIASPDDPIASIRDVKGASVAVRVTWNPDTFFLSSDPLENINRLNKWGQGLRRNTNESFLERGEVVQ